MNGTGLVPSLMGLRVKCRNFRGGRWPHPRGNSWGRSREAAFCQGFTGELEWARPRDARPGPLRDCALFLVVDGTEGTAVHRSDVSSC